MKNNFIYVESLPKYILYVKTEIYQAWLFRRYDKQSLDAFVEI